jgi:hypothetical protein
MNIVYSYIGVIPDYTLDSIKQCRLFHDGKIFFITNDLSNNIINSIKKYNVDIIDYKSVIDNQFLNLVNNNIKKFNICTQLKDRKLLFIRSFERYCLVKNLIKNLNLQNILFLEIDNLIYNETNNLLKLFTKNNVKMSLMWMNNEHISTGLCFIKDFSAIYNMTEKYNSNITNTNEKCISEMKEHMKIYVNNKHQFELLPISPTNDKYNKNYYKNYKNYNSIFDAAGIGVYLFGLELSMTNYKLKLYQKFNWCDIDYTKYKFIFKIDEKNRKIPYLVFNNEQILINNLHIHSKIIKPAMSKN